MTKSYSELMTIESYEDRINYLMIHGQNVGDRTFGDLRYLNQKFYSSQEYKTFADRVRIRDGGNDVGHPDHPINGHIYVHHINPITPEQLINHDPCLVDPENAISCSFFTHTAIHYACEDLIQKEPVERQPNDTCPWKKGGTR